VTIKNRTPYGSW